MLQTNSTDLVNRHIITSSRRTSSLLRISALSNWAFVALTAVSKIPVRLCWYKVVAGRANSGLGKELLLHQKILFLTQMTRIYH